MKLRRFYIISTIICTLFACYSSFGQSKASLTNERKQLEKEIARQKKLLKQTQKNKTASIKEIQLINSQVKKQERLIAAINTEISVLDEEIEQNIKDVKELENNLEALKKDYAQAVYITYKYRHVVNKASFIISAENLGQAIRRVRYLQKYSDALKRDVRLIMETQTSLKQKETELQRSKIEKENLLQDGNRKKTQLSQQKKEKNLIVSKLKKQESRIKKEINRKIQRQRAVNAAINKIIREEIAKSNKIAPNSAKKTASATSAPIHMKLTPKESALASDFESNRGNLPWPVERGSIVTPFGPYSHPEISSVRLNNEGINIITEKGSNVRAVFNGTVSGVVNIGESKVVIIRHGNYLTAYSNLSEVYVSKGYGVKTKQNIGRVYTASGENSSELHFEIRKETKALNPTSWIKR